MNKYFLLVLLLLSNLAQAAPDPKYCEAISGLAQIAAEDRNSGVSYANELKKFKLIGKDMPTYAYNAAKAAAKLVYIDMPKLSPEGAYKFMYAVCTSSS